MASKFLRKLFGLGEPRPARGDTRVNFWREVRGGKWNWNCADGNNEIVCGSNQGYDTRAGCLQGISNAAEALAEASNNGMLVERDPA